MRREGQARPILRCNLAQIIQIEDLCVLGIEDVDQREFQSGHVSNERRGFVGLRSV
jgi:hypothetical protein